MLFEQELQPQLLLPELFAPDKARSSNNKKFVFVLRFVSVAPAKTESKSTSKISFELFIIPPYTKYFFFHHFMSKKADINFNICFDYFPLFVNMFLARYYI